MFASHLLTIASLPSMFALPRLLPPPLISLVQCRSLGGGRVSRWQRRCVSPLITRGERDRPCWCFVGKKLIECLLNDVQAQSILVAPIRLIRWKAALDIAFCQQTAQCFFNRMLTGDG